MPFADIAGRSPWTRGPSAACLLYLFADQIVPHSTLIDVIDQPAVRLPCGRHAVKLGPLERLLVAWAFWHLHEGGLVELAVTVDDEDETATFDGSADVTVAAVGSTAGTKPVAVGLEAAICAACTLEPEPIFDVLARWAGDHTPLPLFAVVRAVHAEAASIGLVRLKEHERGRDPFVDHRLPHFAAENCQRIEELEPDFRSLLASWNDVEDTDAAALETACGDALWGLRPLGAPIPEGPTPSGAY